MLDTGCHALPNLFLIGAPKCGTTSLHDLLTQYDDVFMTSVKEPAFFSRDDAYARGLDHYARTYFRTSAGYRWRGEATPWYLYSRDAMMRIRADLGENLRFIVCLRDPADRAISMYRDQVRAQWEDRTIGEALDAQLDGSFIETRIEQSYVQTGFYARYLREWFAIFGRDKFLVLLYEDLQNPAYLQRRLRLFLGLPELAADDEDQIRQYNAASGLKIRWIARALRNVQEWDSPVKKRIQRVLPEHFVRVAGQKVVYWNTGGRPIAVPPKARDQLSTIFTDSLVELSELIERPTEWWSKATDPDDS